MTLGFTTVWGMISLSTNKQYHKKLRVASTVQRRQGVGETSNAIQSNDAAPLNVNNFVIITSI
jgi:hypothetical protein